MLPKKMLAISATALVFFCGGMQREKTEEVPLINGKHLTLQAEKYNEKRVRVKGHIWTEGAPGVSAPPSVWIGGKDNYVELRIACPDIGNEVFCYVAKTEENIDFLLSVEKKEEIVLEGVVLRKTYEPRTPGETGRPSKYWGVMVTSLRRP